MNFLVNPFNNNAIDYFTDCIALTGFDLLDVAGMLQFLLLDTMNYKLPVICKHLFGYFIRPDSWHPLRNETFKDLAVAVNMTVLYS